MSGVNPREVPTVPSDQEDTRGVSFNSPPVSSYLDDSGVRGGGDADDVMDIAEAAGGEGEDGGCHTCRSSSEPVAFRGSSRRASETAGSCPSLSGRQEGKRNSVTTATSAGRTRSLEKRGSRSMEKSAQNDSSSCIDRG